MSGIENRLGSLNPQSIQAFETVKARNQGQVTAADVPELQAAFETDGLDEEEQALLNALLSGTESSTVGDYGQELEFNPQSFRFNAGEIQPSTTGNTSVIAQNTETPTQTSEAQAANTPVSALDISELAKETKQEEFLEYAEQILHAKLGSKEDNVGAIAKSLFLAFHSESVQGKAQAIADLVIRVNELKQTLPPDKREKLDALIKDIAAPVISRLPANSPLRSIASKLFLQEGKSEGATRALLTVLNGKFEGTKEVKALYDLLLTFGPDIKALLPDNVKEHIESLEKLLGAKFGAHVQSVVKSLASKSPNSDLVKATLKILTGDSVGKVAGSIDFLNAIGQKLVGPDNKALKAAYEFVKIDPRTAISINTLLNPHAAVQARGEALQHLTHTLHERVEKVLEALHPEHAEGVLESAQALERAHITEPEVRPTVEPELRAANDNLPTPDRAPTAEPELRAANDNLPTPDRAPTAEPELRAANDNLPTPERVAPAETAARAEVPRAVGSSADNLAVTGERLGAEALSREARITATVEKLGLNTEARAALVKILGDEKLDEKVLQEGLQLLERLGPEGAQTSLKILQHLETDVARKILGNGELGSKLLQGALKILPSLERLGLSAAEILPKLARGLGKAVPLAGGLVSGFDAARLGSIAARGKDLNGKVYSDPDVRALALLGAGANGLDTALAVLGEGAGVGLLPQLGLALAEVGIDLLVEYYNDNPEKMPQNLRLAIKAAALGVAVGAPFVMPGSGLAASAAVVNIYGLDGTIDIANELTRLVGETSLQGIDRLHELQAKALDQGLKGLTNGINGLADVVRNPEKYAAQLGKSVEEVLSQAYDMLKNAAGQGVEAAKKVYGILTDIAKNPGVYAQKAVDFALQTGLKIGKEVASAVGAAGTFVKDMAVKGAIALADGFKALYDMGAEGVTAAKDLLSSAIQKGGAMATAAIGFARDLVANPGKYGAMAGQMAASAALALRDAIGKLGTKAGDALIALKDLAVQGVANAVQGLKNLVAAGGAMALKTLEFLKDAPGKVAEAIGEGLQAAYRAGKAGLTLAKWVAENPQLALQKLGAAGQQLIDTTRDYLINTAKNIKGKAAEALQALEGLYNRAGAALGRFGDTVVDLMKQGVDVGKAIVGRYWNVIKQRGPELMAALGNLGRAGLDLMAKIGSWQVDAAKWAVEGLMNAASSAGSALKSFALQKLNQMNATQAIVSLVNQGKVALADFKNFSSAAIEKIKSLGSPAALKQLLQSGRVKAQELMNSLLAQGAAGFRKLSQVASGSIELGRAFAAKLSAEISAAWQNTHIARIPPDVAALRALISRYTGLAGQAGADAARWVKQQLVSALSAFDKKLEQTSYLSIPDALINALR
jgi:hypothetical protein